MFWKILNSFTTFFTSFFGQSLTHFIFIFFKHEGTKPAHVFIIRIISVIDIFIKKPHLVIIVITFLIKKLIMSKCLPELESSGRARRPQEWASGQWAHRF